MLLKLFSQVLPNTRYNYIYSYIFSYILVIVIFIYRDYDWLNWLIEYEWLIYVHVARTPVTVRAICQALLILVKYFKLTAELPRNWHTVLSPT